jgi:isopentenyl-diphosphate delta-isomerase
MRDIAGRKADHLDLTATEDVGYRRTALLECVELVHNALPELDYADLALDTRLFGKTLKAPIFIAAMTGGTERARAINEGLAELAEEYGYGFGLGSQRPMLSDRSTIRTYAMRHVAPNTVILGNIGGVQAAGLAVEEVRELVSSIGADALCVHLNPAMEMVQSEGDRNFRGVLDAVERLVKGLAVPVIVKETGSGISAGVARRLREVGVRHVDVSGAGGTSWVAVETERATPTRRGLGETFREWGIPTAATVAYAVREGFDTVIATGGINNGLQIAQALALGATAAGIARPILIAYERGGQAEVRRYLERIELELRMAMLLVGARTPTELAEAPRLIHGPLAAWLSLSA